MKRNVFVIIVFAVVLGLFGSIAFAEKVDVPQYQRWAEFKVGSFVKIKTTSKMVGMTTEMEMTQTLIEVSPEKVVIENKGSTSMGGRTTQLPASTIEFPAKMDKAEFDKANAGMKEVDKGKKEIEVMGKKMKTEWKKYEMTKQGMQVKTTEYINEAVPGHMVKNLVTMEGQMKNESTIEVIDYKAAK